MLRPSRQADVHSHTAGSPSKVYCYAYDELGRQKKIVELQGDGLSQDCATAVAMGLFPPPSYSFAAVAARAIGVRSQFSIFNSIILPPPARSQPPRIKNTLEYLDLTLIPLGPDPDSA
jgi:hypothetical protein